MNYYPILCFKCKGEGKIRENPKATIAGTKYDLNECPVCKGLGSVLCSEDRLTKVS